MREGTGGCDRQHDVSTEGGYHRICATRVAISGVPTDSQGPRYGATAATEIQGTICSKTKTRQQQRRGYRQRSVEEGQEGRGDQNGDRLQVEDSPKDRLME